MLARLLRIEEQNLKASLFILKFKQKPLPELELVLKMLQLLYKDEVLTNLQNFPNNLENKLLENVQKPKINKNTGFTLNQTILTLFKYFYSGSITIFMI